jgi:phosphoglycerate dehydrogenase-like enzyme
MGNGKIHIHIEYNRNANDVFKFNRQHIDDLLRRNPDLAGRLKFTMGDYTGNNLDFWSDEDFRVFYENIADAEILVGYKFPTENLAQHAPNLRWIHFISSGIEHITPFNWVPKNVQIINNRGIHLPKSGESFAMFLRMLNAQVPRLLTAQRNRKWDRVFTTVIHGKTLVVFGVGHQGGEIARQAKNMSLTVIGVDPYTKNNPYCDEILPLERMREAFAKADFLAISAPLTKATRGVIDREKLDWLPQRAGVMNVSRGSLLDHSALHDKLCAGELSGAILDVFDVEPLPADSKIWKTPNLVIMPHVSSDDLVNYIPLTLDLTIDNIRNELAGKPLQNIVDIKKEF